MVVIGIDASTSCTGIGIFDNDELVYHGALKPPESLEWRERIMWQCMELSKLLNKYKPEKMYCEDVPLKAGSFTIQKLGCVQGMILSLCAAYRIEVNFLLPAKWRGAIGLFDGTREGLQRDVLKHKAIQMANELFGLELQWVAPKSKRNQDDTAEAILIAWSQIKPKSH